MEKWKWQNFWSGRGEVDVTELLTHFLNKHNVTTFHIVISNDDYITIVYLAP